MVFSNLTFESVGVKIKASIALIFDTVDIWYDDSIKAKKIKQD